MTRIFTILMILCAYIGLNAADSQPRSITIRPFTGALVPSSLTQEATAGTVKFQKQPYWIRPCYKLFLDGAPALKVCLGFQGTRMDVYLAMENKEIRIVSTNWHGDRYDGKIKSNEALTEAGINEKELVEALSRLPSIHYPLSKQTWTYVQQNAVQQGDIAVLLTNAEQTQAENLARAAEIIEEVTETVQEQTHTLVDKVVEVKDAIEDKLGEIRDAVKDKAQEAKEALQAEISALADQAEEAYTHAVELLQPPTHAEETQAVAEFVESLPEPLQGVKLNAPQTTDK